MIETERLILRPFEADDIDIIFQIYSDSETLHYTPFDPMSKYRKMGFFPANDDGYSVLMRGWRDEITKTFEDQKNFILVKHIENPQDVDLGKELSVLA